MIAIHTDLYIGGILDQEFIRSQKGKRVFHCAEASRTSAAICVCRELQEGTRSIGTVVILLHLELILSIPDT